MMSMTIVNSVLGSVNGDIMNVVMTCQMFNEINNVMIILTTHNRDMYKPHWTNQIRTDSGLPRKYYVLKFIIVWNW